MYVIYYTINIPPPKATFKPGPSIDPTPNPKLIYNSFITQAAPKSWNPCHCKNIINNQF